MRKLQAIFLRGLIVTLPVMLTVLLLVWVVGKFEQLLGPLWLQALGERNYFPGIGLISVFCIIMAIGFMVDHYLTQKIVRAFVAYFEKFPVVKSVYGPIRDFFTLLGGQNGKNTMKNVVMYEVKPGSWMLGLVTRESFEDPSLKFFEEMGLVAVYLPSSFMFGGYTILMKKETLRVIDMPVDQAMKLAITGWIHIDKTNSSL